MCKPNSSKGDFQLLMVISSIIFAAIGCEGTLPESGAEQYVAGSADILTAIDAGVVFADRESYLCVKLERLGLKAGDDVTSVTSSCECVQPSIISYYASTGQNASALLLQFRKETGEGSGNAYSSPQRDSAATPMNLSVLVDLKLADGSAFQLTVYFLHTSIAQEKVP